MTGESLIFASATDLGRALQPLCALGIDLGTTNSSIAEATWKPGEKPECRVLELDQPLWPAGSVSSYLVPSVVALLGDGRVLVGEGAKRLRARPHEENLSAEKNLFYETKNDMGLRRTYHRAPEPYNHASKIAGHILRFLKDAASQQLSQPPSHLCVTVPASFQLNQRRDTILACNYAQMSLQDDDLLDEPTAALIDYIFTQGAEGLLQSERAQRCIVFDFGGGTCDVSIMEVRMSPHSQQLQISQIAVSRYHRLGGGDLDAAIVHEHLIPALLQENELQPLDLTWSQKKRILEPQLLGIAEALKESLCREISRLMSFGKYNREDNQQIVARMPSATIQLGSRSLALERPSLNAKQWEAILEPFLDRDLLYARQTEFRIVQSIFGPLQDALDRAGLKPEEIDFCLMVGGSSLIPQVREAVMSYFHQGVVGCFPDPLSTQLCVARGAAWNSLYKSLTGTDLIQPVLHDALAVMVTGEKLHPLVPGKTALPFPGEDAWGQIELIVPADRGVYADRLLLKIVTEKDRQVILHAIWNLPESVPAGTEIVLEYCVTAGKQLRCRAYLKENPQTVFEHSVENPLVNVVNPGSIRLRIQEQEEELKQRGGGSQQDVQQYIQLARWYAEIGQRERALDWLQTAQRILTSPDAEILNLQGIYYDELGDHQRAWKMYLEADRVSVLWDGPLFNLALSLYRHAQYQEALQTIEKAIRKGGEDGTNLTLKAMCLSRIYPNQDPKPAYQRAIEAFGSPASLHDWELGWCLTAVRAVGDVKRVRQVEAEQQRRREHKPEGEEIDAPLPDVKGGPVVRK
jgi:molecular chaperone DnaK